MQICVGLPGLCVWWDVHRPGVSPHGVPHHKKKEKKRGRVMLRQQVISKKDYSYSEFHPPLSAWNCISGDISYDKQQVADLTMARCAKWICSEDYSLKLTIEYFDNCQAISALFWLDWGAANQFESLLVLLVNPKPSGNRGSKEFSPACIGSCSTLLNHVIGSRPWNS